MSVAETGLAGVLVVTPAVYRDDRGFFLELFNEPCFAAAGLPASFVQDNHSRSVAGVVRGLHYQRTTAQGKLVRVTRGRIFDVAVDVRTGSPTFGSWAGVTLDDESLEALWIPPGFANGFCALAPVVDVVYKCTAVYDPADEFGVVWNDPDIAIDWPATDPRLSDRDRVLPRLRGNSQLPIFHDAAGSA